MDQAERVAVVEQVVAVVQLAQVDHPEARDPVEALVQVDLLALPEVLDPPVQVARLVQQVAVAHRDLLGVVVQVVLEQYLEERLIM
jgi:hypothetical protein